MNAIDPQKVVAKMTELRAERAKREQEVLKAADTAKEKLNVFGKTSLSNLLHEYKGQVLDDALVCKILRDFKVYPDI